MLDGKGCERIEVTVNMAIGLQCPVILILSLPCARPLVGVFASAARCFRRRGRYDAAADSEDRRIGPGMMPDFYGGQSHAPNLSLLRVSLASTQRLKLLCGNIFPFQRRARFLCPCILGTKVPSEQRL